MLISSPPLPGPGLKGGPVRAPTSRELSAARTRKQSSDSSLNKNIPDHDRHVNGGNYCLLRPAQKTGGEGGGVSGCASTCVNRGRYKKLLSGMRRRLLEGWVALYATQETPAHTL